MCCELYGYGILTEKRENKSSVFPGNIKSDYDLTDYNITDQIIT